MIPLTLTVTIVGSAGSIGAIACSGDTTMGDGDGEPENPSDAGSDAAIADASDAGDAGDASDGGGLPECTNVPPTTKPCVPCIGSTGMTECAGIGERFEGPCFWTPRTETCDEAIA